MIWNTNSKNLKKRKESLLSSFISTIDELEKIEQESSAQIELEEAKKKEIEEEISSLSGLKKEVSKIKESFKKIIFVEQDAKEDTK